MSGIKNKMNQNDYNCINNKGISPDIQIMDNNKYEKPKLDNKLKLQSLISSLKSLKNNSFENIFQKHNINEKNDQIKFINMKTFNNSENQKINMRREEQKKKENENQKSEIEIISEDSKSMDNENISINEEEDEIFSLTSNNNSNSSTDSFKKFKSKKIIPKLKQKNVINYQGNKRTILKRKKYYVYQLLQRWWYVFPKWPPDDFDTSELLKENKLRLVERKKWKMEAEINSDDFKKCIELPGYKYVYMTNDGKIYDFRPEKGKPSFNNLIQLSDIEIHQYLVNALKKQLQELEKRNLFNEIKLRKNINNQLKIEKLNLKHIQNN